MKINYINGNMKNLVACKLGKHDRIILVVKQEVFGISTSQFGKKLRGIVVLCSFNLRPVFLTVLYYVVEHLVTSETTSVFSEN